MIGLIPICLSIINDSAFAAIYYGVSQESVLGPGPLLFLLLYINNQGSSLC